MLKYIRILFLSVLVFSCKEDPEISQSQENFNLKVFGGSSTDCCNALYSDGESLFLTGSIDYTQGPDLFLIKTDKYGNEVDWSPKLFGSTATDVGNDIAVDNNQNIILAGFTSLSSGGPTDVFVVKTNANGEELWRKNFGGLRDEKAYAVNVTVPNTIYIAGYTESVDYDIKKRQGWLLALSENGDSLWSHDYGTILVDDELHGISDLKDSLLLVGSTQSLFGNFKRDVFLFILKKSTKGIDNSATLYHEGNETGISAIVSPSGEIIVLGYSEVGSTVNNIMLWKLNENLQVINEKQITSSVSETPSSVKMKDGTLVIVGTSADDKSEDILVYTLDTDFNIISRNQYGSKGNQQGRAGAVIGRSVVVGGCITTGNFSKASIFKTPEILP